VAVLGHGIAVVELVDDDLVQAVLGGRNVLRIGREDVVWEGQNMRWETAVGAGIRLTRHRV